MYDDTIAAISTPLGEGGIGIVRLSGREARSIAERVFQGVLSNRRLSYGHIVDPDSRQTIDEVLVSFMDAPHTYTREDTVEINCHGGPLPLQHVLELVLRFGARLAQPGEFTLRAFLNGRIDLAQAEAVLDIVQAKTQAALRLAVLGVEGRFSAAVKEVRGQLVSVLAYLTARIDFPEDEVEEQDIVPPLNSALARLRELLATADEGIIYRQGVRTAIVGRPNVGKSSLLNRLLRRDRAIVTPVPGTTRDTIEETVNIQGIPFILVDTAGIIHSKELVESMGIERSRRAVEQADLVLLVIDGSESMTAGDEEIVGSIEDRTTIVAANKSDLPPRASLEGLPWRTVRTSALTGEGVAELEERMANMALGGKALPSDALLVSNPRHKSILQRAERHLAQALTAIGEDVPDDFVTIDLAAAASALGEIIGETVQEELLDTIFSNFCVGK